LAVGVRFPLCPPLCPQILLNDDGPIGPFAFFRGRDKRRLTRAEGKLTRADAAEPRRILVAQNELAVKIGRRVGAFAERRCQDSSEAWMTEGMGGPPRLILPLAARRIGATRAAKTSASPGDTRP